MSKCEHPNGYYHGNGDSYCPDCNFCFTAEHHISILKRSVATQQARIDALTKALDYVYRDCKARAEDGVVPLGAGCWDMVCDALLGAADE